MATRTQRRLLDRASNALLWTLLVKGGLTLGGLLAASAQFLTALTF